MIILGKKLNGSLNNDFNSALLTFNPNQKIMKQIQKLTKNLIRPLVGQFACGVKRTLAFGTKTTNKIIAIIIISLVSFNVYAIDEDRYYENFDTFVDIVPTIIGTINIELFSNSYTFSELGICQLEATDVNLSTYRIFTKRVRFHFSDIKKIELMTEVHKSHHYYFLRLNFKKNIVDVAETLSPLGTEEDKKRLTDMDNTDIFTIEFHSSSQAKSAAKSLRKMRRICRRATRNM